MSCIVLQAPFHLQQQEMKSLKAQLAHMEQMIQRTPLIPSSTFPFSPYYTTPPSLLPKEP